MENVWVLVLSLAVITAAYPANDAKHDSTSTSRLRRYLYYNSNDGQDTTILTQDGEQSKRDNNDLHAHDNVGGRSQEVYRQSTRVGDNCAQGRSCHEQSVHQIESTRHSEQKEYHTYMGYASTSSIESDTYNDNYNSEAHRRRHENNQRIYSHYDFGHNLHSSDESPQSHESDVSGNTERRHDQHRCHDDNHRSHEDRINKHVSDRSDDCSHNHGRHEHRTDIHSHADDAVTQIRSSTRQQQDLSYNQGRDLYRHAMNNLQRPDQLSGNNGYHGGYKEHGY